MTALKRALGSAVPPLVTPFTTALDVDQQALAEHVDWLVGQGVQALLAADLVGESWALTADEKAEVIRTAVDAAARRVPVIAKLSEPDQRGQVRQAERAARAGASVIKLCLPRETRAQGEDQAREWVLAPARATGLPVVVESYGDLPPSLVDRLCEEDAFLGIEEAGRDLVGFHEMVRRYRHRLLMIAGTEDLLPYMLTAGAHGSMTATVNFAPVLMRELDAAARAGDAATIMGLFGSVWAFRRLFHDRLREGVLLFASYTKASLALLGRRVGPPRPPLRPLTGAETGELREVLKSMSVLR